MSARDEWPRLASLPDDCQLTDIALRMRDHLQPVLELVSAEALATAVGCGYGVQPIGAATSTVQSLLVPLRAGGFNIVINAHHSPSDADALWLTAHEVAHSFFYTASEPPRRIVPNTPAEECFCDAFADALLSDVVVRQKGQAA